MCGGESCLRKNEKCINFVKREKCRFDTRWIQLEVDTGIKAHECVPDLSGRRKLIDIQFNQLL